MSRSGEVASFEEGEDFAEEEDSAGEDMSVQAEGFAEEGSPGFRSIVPCAVSLGSSDVNS